MVVGRDGEHVDEGQGNTKNRQSKGDSRVSVVYFRFQFTLKIQKVFVGIVSRKKKGGPLFKTFTYL